MQVLLEAAQGVWQWCPSNRHSGYTQEDRVHQVVGGGSELKCSVVLGSDAAAWLPPALGRLTLHRRRVDLAETREFIAGRVKSRWHLS